MKALVLAGGTPQIELIKNLKSKNITVILCDYYDNPIARPYADIFYQISTLDVEKIYEVAQKEKVDFVITVCTDQALLTVAYVSEKLNLPCYIDYLTANAVTNKLHMKDIFVKNSIPTANYVVVSDILDFKIDFDYPMIVKPADCNSSKGVVKVFSKEEMLIALKNALDLSRTQTAIIEEYVQGIELSVDVYVENGKAHVLCVSELEKLPLKDSFIIFRTICPARVSTYIYSEIEIVAQKIATAFKLENSPMLIQLIVSDNGISVLEFSARTGGGEKFKFIKEATGVDVIDAVVNLTLNKKPHISYSKINNYYMTEFIYCTPGVFSKINGFEYLKNNGIILDYYQFKCEGTTFDTICNSGDRIAGYTIKADSLISLKEKYDIANSSIKVLDINNNLMMYKNPSLGV